MSLQKIGSFMLALLIVLTSLTVFATPAKADSLDGTYFAMQMAAETMTAAVQDVFGVYGCDPWEQGMGWCVSVYVANYQSNPALRAAFLNYYAISGLSSYSTLWWLGTPAHVACNLKFHPYDTDAYNACVYTVLTDLQYWAYE